MPIFIPPYAGEKIKSDAEVKIYKVLQDLNLKNVYVLHSLGLPRHNVKIYGEIDFVVVCELGVACLEIKGGRVECRGGKWIFTNRYGNENEKSEGPYTQVKDNMFSLKNRLKERFPSNRHMQNVLVACGVMFPDIVFDAKTEEVIPEVTYDKRTEDISAYMKQVFEYWKGTRESSKLSPSDIEEIISYLRGNFCFVPSLSDRLNEIDDKLIRLTNEQVNIMRGLAANKRLMIEGSAGTGKTVLAMNFVKEKLEAGFEVLYLAFNKNLVKNVISTMNIESDRLKIINIHALFGEYVKVDKDEVKKDAQNYFNNILPEMFLDFVIYLEKEKLADLQVDILVMDEGQDIANPIYLYPLDYLLKGGFKEGNWAFFYDEKQNIYNPEYDEGIKFLEEYQPSKFKLSTNCRNTIQIGTYSFDAIGLDEKEFIKENGEEIIKVKFADKDDAKSKLKEIVKGLRAENIKEEDILFLSPKRYKHSILSEIAFEVNEDVNDKSRDQTPRFSTIHGYKGLDSKVVVMCDLEQIKEEDKATLLYIGASRARTLLYLVGSEEFWLNNI